MAKIRAHLIPAEMNTPTEEDSTHRSESFTYSQPLPTLADTPLLHARHYRRPPSSQESAPVPFPWVPRFLSDKRVYYDGSDIKGHLRLGAAAVHIPTSTTIYIDAPGIEETRIMMRAELVAIYMALTIFAPR